MSIIILFAIMGLLILINFKMLEKREMEYLKLMDKYFYVLKYSIKNMTPDKYNELVKEMEKEFGGI